MCLCVRDVVLWSRDYNEIFISVLSKLVTSLKEAESLSSEQELSFLQNLLESREINALVNVHSKVAKVVKDEKFAPIISNSMQVYGHTISIPKVNAFNAFVLIHRLD